MATTFNRSIQEDFGGMFGIAPNITSGSNRRIEIMSRYSSLGADHEAIQNYDQINMHLTSMYATRDSKALTENGNMILWSEDYSVNQEYAHRGAFDRYYWAGAFEERSTGNVFTHTTINGRETDGFAMIPSPYKQLITGAEYTDIEDNMDSIRLKIKSDGGIPANKFVPLFGYAICSATNTSRRENQSGFYYASDNAWRWKNGDSRSNLELLSGSSTIGRSPKGASIPTAIAGSRNNLYDWASNLDNNTTTPYQSDAYTRNTMLWVIYAHDGNGNATLATCSGEAGTDPLNIDTHYQMRPSNAYFGDVDGYFQWVHPYWFSERLFQNNQTLTQIWNQVKDGGDWYEFQGYSGTQLGRTNFRRIWTHQGEDWKYGTQITTGTGDPGGGHVCNAIGIGGLTQTYSVYCAANSVSYGWLSTYCPFQMIAHGATSNADLAQETEILVNFKSLIAGSDSEGRSDRFLDHFGIHNDIQRNPTVTANHGQAVSINMTGKILDFIFRDIPTIMYYDWWRYYQTQYSESYEDFYKPMRALVLRPSFEAKTEYSSFSISNYGDDQPNELIGGDTEHIRSYYKTSRNTQFVFGNGGFSYDPLAGAKTNPSTSIEDSTNSWDNPENLINNDLTLRANVNNAGIENALYIGLNGTDLFPNGANKGEYEITGFTLNIRGVTLSALDYHDLRFAIVDSTKTTTLFTTNDFDAESLNISDVPINNLTQSPQGDGAYSVYFVTSISEDHYYSDIENGFLKIWVETQNV